MDYKDKIKEILKDKTIPEKERKKLEEILSTAEISEDERIRKKLIEAVKGDMVVGGTKDKQLAIAWLEKRKDYVSPQMVADSYLRGYNDAEKKSLKKQSEQKPAWSEEDERTLQGIWDEIIANKHDAKEYEWKTYDKFLDWLKSLKDRYTWKPSKEQIIALRWVLNNIPYNKHKEEISGLLDQIKCL